MRISDWSSDVCSSDLEAVAVLDDLRGLLEDRHDLLDADHLALGDRGDHDTGRGGADGARQNALGEADEAGLGVAQLGDVEAVGAAVVGEEIGRAHVELQSLMRISYAVFCLKKKKPKHHVDN